jgi:hypothetical protein
MFPYLITFKLHCVRSKCMQIVHKMKHLQECFPFLFFRKSRINYGLIFVKSIFLSVSIYISSICRNPRSHIGALLDTFRELRGGKKQCIGTKK